MNIALIRPPKITGNFEKILIQEPINLAYIAAYLKIHGFLVDLWDFEVEPFSEAILRKKIDQHPVRVAGLTSMSPTVNNAHKLALMLKKITPEIQIIAGGPHVSALPEESLREFTAFDYIIIGEGEESVLKLCEKINKKEHPGDIPGLSFRDAGQIVINKDRTYIQDLDRIPFPARSLFKHSLYKHIYAAGIDMSGKKSTVVFTTRGCAQKCTFCAVKNTNGAKVRFRSAENVIAELKVCRNKFGYNHVTFEDTNLTLDRKRFEKICYGLKNLNLTWDCQTKVSLVDKELIKTMKDCGCLKIAYGVESGSPKVLKLMKKNITIAQIENAFKWTHQANIVACAFFIIGSHPEETREDIKQTENILHRIKPDVFQLGIICPYPGTEIYSLMKKENLIKDISWSKLNFMHANPAWGTKHVEAKELIRYQKKIYLRYLLSPKFLRSLLNKPITFRYVLYLIKLSLYMLKYLVFEKRH